MEKTILTFDEAHRRFRYDATNGNLLWVIPVGAGNHKMAPGDEAGTTLKTKWSWYRQYSHFGKRYLVHRVIWLMVYGDWPTGEIDHIDGNGLNNRINNLRDVSRSINAKNISRLKNNTSGRVGVTWDKERSKWSAQSKKNGKCVHLGRFDLLEDAACSRKEYERLNGFTKRHGAYSKKGER